MIKKHQLLILMLVSFSATAMQRQIAPYNHSFNQNIDLTDLNDTPGQLNRLAMLETQVTSLENELVASQLNMARLLNLLKSY